YFLRFFFLPFLPAASSAASSACTRVFSTLIRAKYLLLASTSVQGAPEVDVRSTMSQTAVSYWSHFLRLRQSSAVILKRLKEIFSRALKRRYCSSLLTASQNLTTTVPWRASALSKSLISA